jgi:hypothetical protein
LLEHAPFRRYVHGYVSTHSFRAFKPLKFQPTRVYCADLQDSPSSPDVLKPFSPPERIEDISHKEGNQSLPNCRHNPVTDVTVSHRARLCRTCLFCILEHLCDGHAAIRRVVRFSSSDETELQAIEEVLLRGLTEWKRLRIQTI